VAGAKGLGNVAVVLAALVGVADQQRDRGAGGPALVHAREDFYRIGLVALGHELRGAGPAAIELNLDVGLAQRHAGRATVDHAADGRAVGFTEVGDAEQGAEGVAAHMRLDYPRPPAAHRREGRWRSLAREPDLLYAAPQQIR
jgi:hypothetical protein